MRKAPEELVSRRGRPAFQSEKDFYRRALARQRAEYTWLDKVFNFIFGESAPDIAWSAEAPRMAGLSKIPTVERREAAVREMIRRAK